MSTRILILKDGVIKPASSSDDLGIGGSLVLGTTSSTAYRGDYGDIAYQHSQLTNSNPHGITKALIGLPLVDNTADSTKVVASAAILTTARTINGVSFNGSSNITINAVDSTPRIATSEKGVANGVVPLNSSALIDSTYLPSSLVLGTTSTTAYRGDFGNAAYTHSQITSGNPHGTTKAQIGLTNVDDTSDANKPVSTATQTALNLKANLASPTFTGLVNMDSVICPNVGRFQYSEDVYIRRFLSLNLYPSPTSSTGYQHAVDGWASCLEQLSTGDIQLKVTTASRAAGSIAILNTPLIISPTGLLTIRGQVKFPSVQVSSTDVNTLDDYVEGVWTATVFGLTAAGDGTYTSRSGTFTKIGRRVFFECFVEWTAHTGTGFVRLSGLPYPSSINAAVTMWYRNYTVDTGSTAIQGYVIPNQSLIIINQVTSTGAQTSLTLDTAAAFMISGSYLTAN